MKIKKEWQLKKVVDEIIKLNNGWGGDFDYDSTLFYIDPRKQHWQECVEYMNWIIDDFVPEKYLCDYFDIKRSTILAHRRWIKNNYDKEKMRDKKLSQILDESK